MKTKCEVYSRVVGYLRPVDSWNEGKQSEFKDRRLFDVGESPSSKTGSGEIEEKDNSELKRVKNRVETEIKVTS
jgi:hypothetical protein